MLRQDDYLKGQLVYQGWLYGKEYGGHQVSCMILSCLMNRVKSGWGNILDVIETMPKYLADAGDAGRPLEKPQIWEPGFIHLLHDVEAIFDQTMDHAKGAMYWADLRRVNTPFFLNKILADKESHPRVCESNSFACFK